MVVELPPPRDSRRDSVLYFTIPKGGTTLLNGIMRGLARRVGLVHADIPGQFFRQGISAAPPSTSELIVAKGYVYGFPSFPKGYEVPILGKSKTVVLVRDPRDVLVSLYYSLRYSHVDPGSPGVYREGHQRWREGRRRAQQSSIDEHVLLSAPVFAAHFAKQQELALLPGARVYRYEDVIYRKGEWIADICNYYGWQVPARHRKRIAISQDVFPTEEQIDRHIRQVHPGNHKTKLRPETISELNKTFGATMAFFGYE